MAHIKILKIDERTIYEFDNLEWVVDLIFIPRKTYKEAVEAGFDVNKWKKNNKQKVFIQEGENKVEV